MIFPSLRYFSRHALAGNTVKTEWGKREIIRTRFLENSLTKSREEKTARNFIGQIRKLWRKLASSKKFVFFSPQKTFFFPHKMSTENMECKSVLFPWSKWPPDIFFLPSRKSVTRHESAPDVAQILFYQSWKCLWLTSKIKFYGF